MAITVFHRRVRYSPPYALPRVAAGNPFTSGLVFATLPGVDGGSGLGFPTTSVDVSQVASPYGIAGSFNGTSSRIELGTNQIGDGDLTFFSILAKSDGNPSLGFAQIIASEYDGTHEPLAFKFYNASNQLRLTTYNTGSSEVQIDVSSVPQGEWCAVYCRATAAGSAGTWDAGLFRRNGTLLSSSATVTGRTRVGYRMFVGSGYFAGDYWRRYDQPIAMAAAWNRYLTDAEILQLAYNPWQLFAAPTSRISVVGSGGGGGAAPVLMGQIVM